MTLIRWEPLRNLARMQDEMARSLRDVFDTVDNSAGTLMPPPVDIVEDNDRMVLLADLPGFSSDDLDLSVENRTLTLSGERKAPEFSPSGRVFRSERPFGRFTRTFSLPATVDVAKIQAEFSAGVLKVTLPKAEDSRPRKIQVQAH